MNKRSTPIRWMNESTFAMGEITFRLEYPARNESDYPRFTMIKNKRFIEEYEKLTDENISHILELGMFQGGSMVFFDKLFSPRKLVGIDIRDAPIRALETYRANGAGHLKTYYQSSQDDPVLLQRVFEQDFNRRLDLVVDDASHQYQLTKNSFRRLFPRLRPGGLYIIEDWAWSHAKEFQSPDNPWYRMPALTNLMFDLIVELGSDSDIEDIRFSERMAQIRKKTNPRQKPLFQGNLMRDRTRTLI